MNFFGTNHTRSLFNTSIIYNGIDLINEFHNIIYGSGVSAPLGHWIVYRRFNRTKHSKYWDSVTKEAVGGPAFEFSDEIIRTRRIPNPRANTDELIKPGTSFDDEFVYYLEVVVNPKRGDEIFEIDLVDHSNQPSYESINLIERYIINRVNPYRMENGNVQYFAVIGNFNEVKY